VPAAQAAALSEALLHLCQAEAVQQRPVPGEDAVDLTGAPPVLREAILVAIDEAGERVSRHCTSLLRGEGSRVDALAKVDAVRGLLELLGRAPTANAAPRRS
jgi:hypothetical protein